jgi:Flp pilus assembly protein TadG
VSQQSKLRRFQALLHNDEGGAAVSFILALPIFLWIIAIFVQFALMMNAKISIDNAAAVAARAAVTSLPEGKPENVTTAACMALAPLSPQATGQSASDAQALFDALQATGVPIPETFPARYTYAMEATKVSWDPDIDFTTSRGRELNVSLVYRFKLTVPGANMLIGSSDTIGGVQGRYLDIASASCRVQTSHSRKTGSDGAGSPD